MLFGMSLSWAEVVATTLPFFSMSEIKLLCDQMLVRLGRWLRAAGYDTAIIENSQLDHDILDQAKIEGRLLLTRDRHFLHMKEGENIVIWLKSNDLIDCVKELTKTLKINWMYKPFSRCLVCNGPLKEAPPTALKLVPLDVLTEDSPLLYCPHCQKVYWHGSHVERMLHTLQTWQNENQIDD